MDSQKGEITLFPRSLDSEMERPRFNVIDARVHFQIAALTSGDSKIGNLFSIPLT